MWQTAFKKPKDLVNEIYTTKPILDRVYLDEGRISDSSKFAKYIKSEAFKEKINPAPGMYTDLKTTHSLPQQQQYPHVKVAFDSWQEKNIFEKCPL